MNSTTSNLTDRQIVVSRHFDAPRELVFAAWTDPAHLPNWRGPRGFTTRTHEIDVRPGGAWRYLMVGPDGAEYPNEIRYREIVAPERIEYRHGSGEEDGEDFNVRVLFDPDAGGTRVTMTMTVGSAGQRASLIEFGAVEGANQTLDRLAEHLGVATSD